MTNTHIETVQILHDKGGRPVFAFMPFADYQALVHSKAKLTTAIPIEVVESALEHQWSSARAWREYLGITQTVVAQRMGITQGSYAQLEVKKTIRKTSRQKIAKALSLDESQLDF